MKQRLAPQGYPQEEPGTDCSLLAEGGQALFGVWLRFSQTAEICFSAAVVGQNQSREGGRLGSDLIPANGRSKALNHSGPVKSPGSAGRLNIDGKELTELQPRGLGWKPITAV